ncbi:recombinase family protein [Actinomadura geliboluensis]|uniref:recombinase family protein n=1 Tax=Actinomadura geliboluensis TaxID=882440 RepID=UPI00371D790D
MSQPSASAQNWPRAESSPALKFTCTSRSAMPLIIRPSWREPHGQAPWTPRRPAAGRLARLEYARPGDTLVVPSLDRLSRAAQDLITIVAGLRARAASGSAALHEASDTTMPGGPPGLPRLRRPGRFRPRTHRGEHPRGPGRGPRPAHSPG